MNPSVDFVFVVHNHQPVGNFDFVIEQHYLDCYELLLDALEKHPDFRLGLHYSGHLWEYIEDRHPSFIERLKSLVSRKQVELLGGAHYEAVIPVLPDRDADIQLSSYKREMEKHSGGEVKGMWLAERVWEPGMPSILERNGYRYTFLDEAHFSAAGVSRENIHGIFITEDRGSAIKIFPIDKELRYLIPFQPAEKAVDELIRRLESGIKLITYGDDGEKFGGWPGTKKWVYDDGWLESFLSAIENDDRIRMLLPGEAAQAHTPQGLVYLPCASYIEMGEWALPAESQVELRRLKSDLEKAGLDSRALPFLRGGFWRQFFAKYPESYRIYRRMLRVSGKVAHFEEYNGDTDDARRALMRGQSNDAYWHGVFGGIYIPHLRYAVESQLMKAEYLCERAGFGHSDEPTEELELNNRFLRIIVEPSLGGGISALDVKPAGLNLAGALSRRREAYHTRLEEASSGDDCDHRTIHDRLEVKEKDLKEKLAFDQHQRLCFIDRFLKPGFSIEELEFNRGMETGDFLNGVYTVSQRSAGEIVLARTGEAAGREVSLRKRYTLSKQEMRLDIDYQLRGDLAGLKGAYFAPELNINLMAPDAPDRYFLLDGKPFKDNNLGSRGDHTGPKAISLVDEYLKVRVDIEAYPAPRWVWHPVETISLSEGGVERVYQGSAALAVWKLAEEADYGLILRVFLI